MITWAIIWGMANGVSFQGLWLLIAIGADIMICAMFAESLKRG